MTLDRLRNDIISGRLPSGSKVKQEKLKELYGVGISPIREALFQLAGEGLLRSDSQRGFRVAELNQNELHDITEWRAKLECEALRRSIARGDVNWEANAMAALHKLKGVQADKQLGKDQAGDLWEERHREFHFALYRMCGSPWLLRFCELLIQNGERYRRSFVQYRNIPQSITEEHEAILDAAIKRDHATAVSILDKHIRHAAELAHTHLTRKTNNGASASASKVQARRRK
ncbi:GntR family transcriptional regulator [Bradyrhizobium sp. USDA 4463]